MGDRFDLNRCPAMTDLVLAHDDELTRSERKAVSSHLDRCPACRELADQIDAFTEAYGELLGAQLEEDDDAPRARAPAVGGPPSGRPSGRPSDPRSGSRPDYSLAAAGRRFHSFRRALHEHQQRNLPRTPVPLLRRWMPSAAAVIVTVIVGVALFSRSQTVVLNAEELLTRVAKYERERPPTLVHRMQIRVTFPEAVGRPRGASLAAAPISIIREVAHDHIADHTVGHAAARDRAGARAGGLADARAGAQAGALPPAVAEVLATHRYDVRRWLDLEGYLAWRQSLPSKHDRVTRVRNGRLLLHTTTPHGLLRETFLLVDRETYHVVQIGLLFEGIGRVDIEEISQWVRPAPVPAPPLALAAPSGVTGTGGASAVATSPGASAAGAAQPRLAAWLAATFVRDETLEMRTTFVPGLTRDVASVRQQLHALRGLAQRHPEDRALRREIDRRYRALRESLLAVEFRLDSLAGQSRLRPRRPASDTPSPSDWRRAADVAAHGDALARQVQQLLTFDTPPTDDTHPASPQALRRTLAAIQAAVDTATKPASIPE